MGAWLNVLSVKATRYKYLFAITFNRLSPTLVAGTGDSPPLGSRPSRSTGRAHSIVLRRIHPTDTHSSRAIQRRYFMVFFHSPTEGASKLQQILPSPAKFSRSHQLVTRYVCFVWSRTRGFVYGVSGWGRLSRCRPLRLIAQTHVPGRENADYPVMCGGRGFLQRKRKLCV